MHKVRENLEEIHVGIQLSTAYGIEIAHAGRREEKTENPQQWCPRTICFFPTDLLHSSQGQKFQRHVTDLSLSEIKTRRIKMLGHLTCYDEIKNHARALAAWLDIRPQKYSKNPDR